MIFAIISVSILALVFLIFKFGKTAQESDIMKQELDDIYLAKAARENEKKVINAREKFTRGN